jgi:hypothetical protein
MADVQKILRLVAEGRLTAEEADEILHALDSAPPGAQPADEPPAQAEEPASSAGAPRHLRIEVTENGRRVVNLRVPINIAGWASSLLPGLSDQDANRIRGAIASGVRGAIVDIDDENGDRVLIISE